ncbi:SPFH domain-containing protein [Shewanella sp. 3B26]|jgi:regulator of protease activity HflC (stomatin/prohibitin superfamily)|uniref:SPFH domain-containing protein n=1 Tax=Shewanella zhuhaiensis TaxID=2919576 RepID=A0AAJ1EY48_9GAMM|nr:SPFH domain-containing protein [Shewanella zhuhaiensis]MCH4294739.1 SPFH domain-containing protein [Shewanella zhuhaiensis]
MIQEKRGFSINGYLVFTVLVALHLCFLFVIVSGYEPLGILGNVLTGLCWPGFFMVQPNQAKVLTLFGSYVGSVRATGLQWTIPLFAKRTISLRIRNFESAKIKVNDNLGNPIEIATIVVWSVTDSAEAVFEVDDYESYVSIQSEAALRNMASSYAYDPQDESEVALRSHPQEIADKLKQEIQDRLGRAGVTVHEARISHLAYAQEIASAMLQRQQATAIIAARAKIVEGAVGMVEMALERLKAQNVVELDEERKAVMVSNLLVVLCGDKSTQPVVNTGSLY